MDARAALLRRVDNKYILASEDFAPLAARLAPDHEVLEIDDRRCFSYESVYFDTPTLRCFRDHVEGERPRFKARTRLYRDTGHCVCEVKLKLHDGETDKRQLDYDREAKDRVESAAAELVATSLDEVGISLDESLGKSLETSFRRVTFSGGEGPERLTCDFEVCLARDEAGARRLRGDLVLLESKSESGEAPADRLLAEVGVEPISLSKYKVGVGLLVDPAGDGERDPAERFFV